MKKTTKSLLAVGAMSGLLAVPVSTSASVDDESAPGAWSAAEGSESRTDALVEAATADGRIVVYSSMGPEVVAAQGQLFGELYPGINVEFVRMSNNDLLQRVINESRSGNPVADLVVLPGKEMLQLRSMDALAAYESPFAAGFAPDLRDDLVEPDHLWAAMALQPWIHAYNTDRIAREDVPVVAADVLDPELAGRMGRGLNSGDQWIAQLVAELGEEEAMTFVEQASAQGMTQFGNNSDLVNAVSAGQIDVALSTLLSTTLTTMADGAPIDFVTPAPLYVAPTYVAILSDAPHPNAAALAFDFMLAPEGAQSLFPGQNNIGPLADVEYPNGDLLTSPDGVVVMTPDFIDNAAQYQTLYEDLFVR